jgi:hypothetical protein
LPVIESGECGNGVIEGRENCDTFAPNPGGICRPKGSVGECHLDCSRVSMGERGLCPAGFGCDNNGLCRAPTGDFDEDIKLPLAGVESLVSGDFDGDGRSDLITREPADAALRGKPTLHYFDERGALAESRPFPKPVAEPYVGDIDGDHLSDFVFTTFYIGAMFGRADRNWVPQTFSSYLVPDAHLRIVGVLDRGVVSGDTSVVALTTLAGETGLFVPGSAGTLRLAARLPAPVEALAGTPSTGDIVEGEKSPCREIVVAYRGASSFSLFDLCDFDGELGIPSWKEQAGEQSIALSPPAAIETGPLIADLDGDGHLDVLVGASGRVYCAYGDGERLGPAKPFALRNSSESVIEPNVRMPLAVGEFSGDDITDFVFPEYILSSVAGGKTASGYPVYAVVYGNDAAPWTEAVIADMNGNGKADVLAGSGNGLNLSFFNGTDGLFLAHSSIPTVGSVEHLTIGDFDGDLLNDVAFMEHAASAEDTDSLRIAFGAPAGAPAAPVTVARVEAAEQVAAFADAGFSSLGVAFSNQRGGRVTGQLATLEGGDRLPLALRTLVSLESDGSIASLAALAISVGAFVGARAHDVVALANNESSFAYWLVPAISDSSSAAVKLSGALDPALTPIVLDAHGATRLAAAGAALDLNGDHVDESLWIMPADAGATCALVWFDVEAGAHALLPRGTLRLAEPCEKPALAPIDADGDGRVDVAVLTSSALSVVWNDGAGSLHDVTRVSDPARVPRAFTWLPRSSASPALAFVTSGTLEVASGSGRDFAAPTLLRSLEAGTGIACGDFNGDGVSDLAFVDAGKVRLATARLVPP